jgi:hypothetical protein
MNIFCISNFHHSLKLSNTFSENNLSRKRVKKKQFLAQRNRAARGFEASVKVSYHLKPQPTRLILNFHQKLNFKLPDD